MSAIAGFWSFEGSPEAADRCRRSLDSLAAYGRGSIGQWSGDGVALGRRLTRFLPEDIYDDQPLIGTVRHCVLVADVRLDNRDELISSLEIPAEGARTMCDAAILLAAVERWDRACFSRLAGDYAVAWWDPRRRRLTLGRDHIGNRPLHYHTGSGFFAFASMPKGLHALPEIPCGPDEQSAAEFLALLPPGGYGSFFKDIKRLPAGHFAVVEAGSFSIQRYWEPSSRKLSLRKFDEYVEGLRHYMDVAVQSRLRGVNEVGAHLSSGLDSSSVAATAARALRSSGGRVVAFTSVPREGFVSRRQAIVDESLLADATVRLHPNMEHILVRSEGRVPGDDVDRNFVLYERPVFNLCNNTWQHAINDAARARGLKVLLTGEMGNMTLSYDGAELLAELLRTARWVALAREIATRLASREVRLCAIVAQTFAPFVPQPVWQWVMRRTGRGDPRLEIYSALNAEAASHMKRRARAIAHDYTYRPKADGFKMRLDLMRFTDLGNYRKGMLGGWGIDVRDPTGDRRLIEFCLSVPTELFRFGGRPRALALSAMADRLPKAVLEEKRKGYQTADWYERLAGARPWLIEEVERLRSCDAARRLLDLPRLHRLLHEWPQDDWESVEVVHVYRHALLRGISMGHFLRKASSQASG